ncbi:hypothetical protein [Thalassotalea fusca]
MNLNIELTRDGELLAQYYKLREKSFQEMLGISEFNGAEEALDRSSDIMIARVGERCIGGIRICGAHQNVKIPLEKHSGFLAQQLSNLDLPHFGYCQWMRCTICPEFGMPRAFIQHQFILATVLFSAALGYRYGFCASSRAHHRFYKRILSKFGYEYNECGYIAVEKEPEFTNLEHVLYIADLHSSEADAKENSGFSACGSLCLNLEEQESICQSMLVC